MKEHRTTEEEMEGPTSSWGSRNRKHTQPFRNMMLMIRNSFRKFVLFMFCNPTDNFDIGEGWVYV